MSIREFEIKDKDDELGFLSLSKHLDENNERIKNLLSEEINLHGEKYIREINKKKRSKKNKQNKLIRYIIKHTDQEYDEDELLSYSFQDVKEIYDDLKQRKSPFQKFIQFIFNIE